MKAKKTIEIKELVEWANELLAAKENDYITKEFKEGVCTVIEHAMSKAKSYNGFMFNNVIDCDYGTFGHASRKYFLK